MRRSFNISSSRDRRRRKAGRWERDHHAGRFLQNFRVKIAEWVLLMAGFLMVMAAIIYAVESRVDGALIRSYPQALWYTLVTISTVGYGDHYPVSNAGRLLGSFVIIFSLGFMGYIVSKIQDYVVDNNRRRHLGMYGTDFTRHYVVIGWNAISRTVITELLRARHRVALLAPKAEDLQDVDSYFPHESSLFRTFGLYEDETIYKRLNVAEAAGAVLLCQDDAKTLITAVQLRKQNGTLPVTAHIENIALKETIRHAGVSYVASSNEIVGRMMASAAFEPDVNAMLEDLLSTAYEKDRKQERGKAGGDAYDIQEYRVGEKSAMSGKRFGDVVQALQNAQAGRALAVSRKRPDADDWVLDKDPDPDRFTVAAGDYLVAVVNVVQAANLMKLLDAGGQGRSADAQGRSADAPPAASPKAGS